MSSSGEFWGLFTGRDDQFHPIAQFFNKLEAVRENDYTKDGWRKFILMVALLTKRNFPSCLSHSVQKYIDKAKNQKADVGKKEWNDMKSEMLNAI